jgi:hypothetical protein
MRPVFFQVLVKVNNGIRDFSTSVTPKQSLCDGRWHRITGKKNGVSGFPVRHLEDDGLATYLTDRMRVWK